MPDGGKPNWALFEAQCSDEHRQWLQSLSPEASLTLYEDLWRFAASVPMGPAERARLEQARWEEKLALRRRMLAAFRKLDEARRE